MLIGFYLNINKVASICNTLFSINWAQIKSK